MIKDKSIFIKNVYYMLAYAFQDLKPDQEDDISGESFDHIHDLLTTILAKGIAHQLKQGMHREYIDHTENLTTVRGKINIEGTIKNRFAHKQAIMCEYDELSENNLLNQILKTASMLLLRHADVSTAHHDDLKRHMLFFENVDEIDPASIRWSQIRFTRNSQGYRMLIAVCRLVLEGMLLTDEAGDMHLMTYVKPNHMEKLYEKFILEYYSQECTFVEADAPYIKWAVDDGFTDKLPNMKTDTTLSDGDATLIIDAKYYTRTMQRYRDSPQTIHSHNLYQIFSYVKNKEAELARTGVPHKVSGMLLYAKTDEDICPDYVYQMSGNQISVKTLDLNMPFSDICAQLDAIAESHFLNPHVKYV